MLFSDTGTLEAYRGVWERALGICARPMPRRSPDSGMLGLDLGQYLDPPLGNPSCMCVLGLAGGNAVVFQGGAKVALSFALNSHDPFRIGPMEVGTLAGVHFLERYLTQQVLDRRGQIAWIGRSESLP